MPKNLKVCDVEEKLEKIDKRIFALAKMSLSWDILLIVDSERKQVDFIIGLAKSKWLDLASLSYEWFLSGLKKSENIWNDDSDYVIYEEMNTLRDIVHALKKIHILFLDEIRKWENKIVMEKDHNDCAFSHYLAENENKIKNKFLLSIITLIKEFHEKFHSEIRNNNDFKSIIYLNDLLDILDIFLKHEEAIYFDEWTWLPNLEKFKNDLKESKSNIIHLIKLSWISDINLWYSYDIWNEVLLKVVEKFNNYFQDRWLTLYRISGLEFWIIWWDELFFRDFYEANRIFGVNLWGISLPIRISIWWAKGDDDLYDKACKALYESKWTLWYAIYSPTIESLIKERINNNIKWIIIVKEALKDWNLVTYFQWIRDNNTWEIIKEEALVRIEKDWKVYTPYHFLEQAKKWGLLWEVTKVVLKDVIFRIKKYKRLCSINISEEDLSKDTIVELIIDSINESWISPDLLEIEVLETITNSDLFFENIKKLKGLWVKIAIDDFWTWYSNFARLMILKPNHLKIDWSLIKWISKNKDMQSVVRSILNLAQIIWSKVVAEYVDNDADQSILEAMWVHYSQWFLFSKPKKWD